MRVVPLVDRILIDLAAVSIPNPEIHTNGKDQHVSSATLGNREILKAVVVMPFLTENGRGIESKQWKDDQQKGT